MKRILLLSALLSLYSISVSGQYQPFSITHGPWLCDMSETAVTIVWLTNRNALSWVEIAPTTEVISTEKNVLNTTTPIWDVNRLPRCFIK